jgi:predicted DNA-binding WGR domain protein
MMAEITIALEARDPGAGCFRAWRVEAGPDLFGAWVAQVRFGRIGCAGRVVTRAFASEAAARAFIDQCLRRRATAPHRIGVAYRSIYVTP